MGTLLDLASLVVVPSGYKEDVVYSVKPTDGSGDLDFTRSNDTATRVNSAGLIEKVRTNLVTYSEDFANAAWVVDQVTKTTGQTDPNGGTTAVLATSTNTTGVYFYQTSTGAGCMSVYAKAGTRSTFSIIPSTFGNGAFFNLSSETAVAYGTGSLPKIEDVGGGWFRCSVAVSASGNILFSLSDIGGGGMTIGDSMYFAFAQRETGDIATDYIPTTSAAVSVGMTANVPRLDYSGGGCPKLLLEPQRSNLVTFSEQFDNAAWTKTSIAVTANATTSPDGYDNADLLTTTSASICGAYQLISTSSGTFSFSIFAKKGNNNYLALNAQASSANNCTAIFDLSDGTLGEYQTKGTTAYVSHKIENLGNDWYRCTMVLTTTTSVYFFPLFAPLKTGNTFTSSGEVSVASGKTLYLWGCQVEEGSYGTSYIPTLAAAVTRGADACSKTGISSLIGQTEGTVFFDWIMVRESASTSEDYYPITISDGTSANMVTLNNYNSSLVGYVSSGGSGVFVNNSFSGSSDLRIKAAIAYKANDFAFYVNGVQIATDTSGAAPVGLSQLNVNTYFSGAFNDDTKVNQLLLFKTRLSNTQLAELTTP